MRWEELWIELFCSLRDGTPAVRAEVRGTSGMLIKASQDQQKIYVGSKDETREQGGRETISTIIPGETPQIVLQPKIIESPQEMKDWRERVKSREEKFQRRVMGDDPRVETVPAFPAERHIWEALKRARNPAQVRTAYNLSNIWLKSRLEFPSGGYFDWSWSPYPRALYEHAAEFCLAKLDSRYPVRDNRESGDYRRVEYLARVMAGLSLPKPIRPSYSIELFRKMKHSDKCNCWRCANKIAPRFPRSLARYLIERHRCN